MAIASHVSNFYLDGEAAFMDGLASDQNPYLAGDEAAEAWHAGWLAANYATLNMGLRVDQGALGNAATRFSNYPF